MKGSKPEMLSRITDSIHKININKTESHLELHRIQIQNQIVELPYKHQFFTLF